MNWSRTFRAFRNLQPDMTRAALNDFLAPDIAAWEKAARKALKLESGAPLQRSDDNGLPVSLLYTEAAPAFSAASGHAPGFAQRIDLPDPAQALAQAQEDLSQGATALVVAIKDVDSPSPFGVELTSQADVDVFCEGLPEMTPLRLEAGLRQFEFAGWFAQKRRTLHAGFDVIGLAARTGVFDNTKHHFEQLKKALISGTGPALIADARVYHDAGANDVQEIAFTLAAFVENLRQLKMPVATVLPRMTALLTTDALQFQSLIKLRAMRMAYRSLCNALGVDAALRLGVETSRRMLTCNDVQTNLIRNTLAAFAAIAGGANGVTIVPHTAALGLADPFARRMARNTLNIMAGECALTKVDDPAAGSFYVEDMTAALAQKAWALFQQVETQGGLLAALQAGFVQQQIADTRSATLKAYKNKERQIVGVTVYKSDSAQTVCVLAPHEALPIPHPLALTPHRIAQDFEAAL